jgi:hypothetical protein
MLKFCRRPFFLHLDVLRKYATVSVLPLRAAPPPPPPSPPKSEAPSVLDQHLLSRLASSAPSSSAIDVISLARQYSERARQIINVSLPYESRPNADRRVNINSAGPDGGMLMIAHCILDELTQEHKIALSSGFALNALAPHTGESLILSCAHTVEEVGRTVSILLPLTIEI